MAKILLIDDNPYARSLIKFMLFGKDYTFLEAGDGPSGIALASAERPDLVLLDLMLPFMPGLDVARYFYETDTLNQIPIIVTTAMNYKEYVVALREYQVKGYLLKPLKAEILQARVQKILGPVSPGAEPAPPQAVANSEVAAN